MYQEDIHWKSIIAHSIRCTSVHDKSIVWHMSPDIMSDLAQGTCIIPQKIKLYEFIITHVHPQLEVLHLYSE